jgi:RNA polymerase-binding transcription factor DksA
MDELDYAWEHVELFTQSALNATLTRKGRMAPSTGVCKSCLTPIESDRLKANPNARLCCECAIEEEEMSQRQRRCGP